MVSNHSEGTFGRLRYSLGGDRPSQTVHQALSIARITGSMLESQNPKGGIPRLTPQRPKPLLRSLPPILCIKFRNSIPNYSKALWGLSVQSRVIRIFTHSSTSPGPLLRQCPNHYTIHAGRNLPDKEFRYLRTIIVIAAVHWGLNSMLRITPNKSS